MIRYLIPLLIGALTLSGCNAPDADGRQVNSDSLAGENSAETDPEINPEINAEINWALALSRDVLATEIDRLALEFGGSTGIAVIDIKNGWSTGFEEEKILPQQSVSKLWVAITALEHADRGELSLSDKVRLTRDDLAVFHQPIRARILNEVAVEIDIAELIERALTESDNTANDAVLNAIGGPDAVRAMLAKKEMIGIRFGPGERMMQSAIAGLTWRQSYAFTGMGFFDARELVPANEREIAFNSYQSNPVDGATPLAIASALARLSRAEILSAGSRDWLISVLRRTKSGPNRLKAGVPDGWEIAHKTGTGQYWNGRQSGYNDVGLLLAPDGCNYAVAVMIGETRRETPDRMELMQGVARAVAEYHNTLAENRSS
ncbi:serine hydrolase [Aurantiacibacter marinus]|uniref:beta-lactamase n=1 Tax=Aurantiacibacter marinus TaxID=874156 RepID=A0A0H0XM52_9SPHN|nr:serine hydrolase [Aurantiacibacter marinus]KLI63101.1 hypothetical protein AAV99_10350 [Aurantiacibacter marinus]